VLEELDFLGPVERAGFHRNLGNSVWWAGEEPRVETFPDGASGFHADRAGLERVLVEAAAGQGVELVKDATARSAEEGGGGWSVRCERGRSSVELRAPWVVDATGRHGLIARREGRVPDGGPTTIALVRRWRMRGGWTEPDTHRTLVESYADGWVWSVPLGDDVRCFTAMMDRRHIEGRSPDVEALIERELAKTRYVGPARAGAEPLGEAWACAASTYTAERFCRPGLVLAGDAGAFIDPLSSFGVKKALSSGWLAGVVAHTALVDPPLTDVAVAFFDAREREIYERYRRVSAGFYEQAAAAHGGDYWSERAAAARRHPRGVADSASREGTLAGSRGPVSDAGGDPAGLGSELPEGEVRRAFDEIRAREALAARRGSSVRMARGPGIRGHRIVLEERLVSDRAPAGIRYIRGVDLLKLLEIVPRFPAVPDGWAAYNAAAPPVTLPDYLTALSTAFAAGFLEHELA
jgi:flavin-dependent dehydrogenase